MVTARVRKFAMIVSVLASDKFADGILCFADRRAHSAFGLVGTAFGFETTITSRLAGGLLDSTGSLSGAAYDAFLVHN